MRKNPRLDGRAERIVQCASGLLPSTVIAHLLGITLQRLQKARRSLGVTVGPAAARTTYAEFCRKLPELDDSELTHDERREVAVQRQCLIQRKNDKVLGPIIDLLYRYVDTLPTAVLVDLVGRHQEWVLDRLREEDILPSLADQRAITRSFEAAKQPPVEHRESAVNRKIIVRHWEAARERQAERNKKNEARKKTTGEKKLGVMQARREALRLSPTPPIETLCTGTCGETWPRTSCFFAPSFRSRDELSNRCLYCTFIAEQQRRASKGKRPVRKMARRLNAAEELRCRELLARYGLRIPGEVFARWFNVSENTIYRIRCNLRQKISAMDSRRTAEAWSERHVDAKSLPGLSAYESERLFAISQRWAAERAMCNLRPPRSVATRVDAG